MAAHTLGRNIRKPLKYGLQIAGNACLLGRNGKPACGTVHRRSGILHPLRHVFGDFRCAVQSQRRHAEPRFRELGSDVRVTHGEMRLNFLQRLEVITHVGQRVLDQRRRKLYELTGIRSDGSGCVLAVLMMLSRGERRAAASQNKDDDDTRHSHVSPRKCCDLGPTGFKYLPTGGISGLIGACAGRRTGIACHTMGCCDMIAIMSIPIEPFLSGLRARQWIVDAGQLLFHRGDTVKEVHFILTGSVHLVRYQSDGSTLILQRAGPGSILAEASLYSETYHCDAVASGRAEIKAYSKASVRRLLANSPEFSHVWARFLAGELQGARLRAEILSLKTVAGRLDAWIAWNGGDLPEKGEWKLVANEIAVSPEALYRELARRRR